VVCLSIGVAVATGCMVALAVCCVAVGVVCFGISDALVAPVPPSEVKAVAVRLTAVAAVVVATVWVVSVPPPLSRLVSVVEPGCTMAVDVVGVAVLTAWVLGVAVAPVASVCWVVVSVVVGASCVPVADAVLAAEVVCVGIGVAVAATCVAGLAVSCVDVGTACLVVWVVLVVGVETACVVVVVVLVELACVVVLDVLEVSVLDLEVVVLDAFVVVVPADCAVFFGPAAASWLKVKEATSVMTLVRTCHRATPGIFSYGLPSGLRRSKCSQAKFRTPRESPYRHAGLLRPSSTKQTPV
jgi:hypothetical protein